MEVSMLPPATNNTEQLKLLEDLFKGYGVRSTTVIKVMEMGFTVRTLVNMMEQEIDDVIKTMMEGCQMELLVGERYGLKSAIRAEKNCQKEEMERQGLQLLAKNNKKHKSDDSGMVVTSAEVDWIKIELAQLRRFWESSCSVYLHHEVGDKIMESSMWGNSLSPEDLENYLGEPVANVDSMIQKVLSVLKNPVWDTLAASDLNKAVWDTLAARGLKEYNAMAAVKEWKRLEAKDLNDGRNERFIQVALWYLCLLVKDLCPDVQWYAIDTSVSGIPGVYMKPDISLCSAAVACLAEIVTLFELKCVQNVTNYASAVGQLKCRSDVLFSSQPGRSKLIMAYITRDVFDLVVFHRTAREVRHSGAFSLSFDKHSNGLRLFMRMLLTSSLNLGYVTIAPPVIPPSPKGFTVENLVLVSIPKPQVASLESLELQQPSLRGTKVYLCQIIHQETRGDAVLKLGRVKKEAENLQKIQLIPGVIRLVDSGECPDGDFLITEPQGERLSLKMKAADIFAAISQIATTIKNLYDDYKMVHRDISIGNIIWVKGTKKAYLIDWATAAELELIQENYEITGTLMFMSINVLGMKKSSVSTDLESLMYVLLYIAAGGRLPWRKNVVGNNWHIHKKVKYATMKQDFEELAEKMTEDLDLKRGVENLRNLFFVPDYRIDVTVHEFLEALIKN